VFITFFYGELDLIQGEFRYVNAGHNAPLLLSAGGGIRELEGTGMALGMLPGSLYEEGRVVIAPGDVLVLYTDGISESRNVLGEDFGPTRMVETVRARREGTAKEIIAAVFSAVREFTAGADPLDDRTLLVVRRPAEDSCPVN
jgi:sigma-B regulation protein RsbU (phosphoserine phosphatase)